MSPAATAESYAGGMTDEHAEDLARVMVRDDPLYWWENYPRIENKKHELVQPVANVLQTRVAEAVVYCRKQRLPIRLVILKPRQKGISTITVAILQWLQKIMPRDGLIVGGKDWQVDNLWSIYRRYAESDTFPWGFAGFIQDQKAEWGNGSKLKRQTAGGKDPGRSAAIQALVNTEVAYWGHDASVKNAGAVHTGLLACVPHDEDTLVVDESTSAGGSGLFYRRWDGAVDLEAFLAGARSASGTVRIFAGWHEFEDSFLPVADAKEEAAIFAGIGALNDVERQRERDMRLRYKLTAGQIKYWRKLLSDCDNDPDKRDREFPTTPEDAFRAAQPCRFNLSMLRQMRDEAINQKDRLQFGMLDQPVMNVARYVWRPVPEAAEANFIIHEHPIIGCRYSMSVDNAGGRATGDDKGDTDNHAVIVGRDGYMDAERRCWLPPAVVATIKPKQKVDIDILAEWAWRLSCYYGRCKIVPEANNDRGLILLLRQRGADIYEQERPATQVASHKPSGKFGFWTRGGEHENTRNWIIENLAKAVRELQRVGDGIFCPFLFILDECEHFATDPDTGKAQAMEGWHDDWVMAVAIWMATKAGGTVYQAPMDEVDTLPRDLKLARERKLTSGADRV
jgi:hypothetical protein